LVFDRAGLGAGDGSARVASRVASLVDAGVDWLQVRDRSLEADALFEFVRAVVAGARAADHIEAEVIVNRRLDVALAAEADGVHLGFDALSVGDARTLLGPAGRLGVSCHSLADIQRAADEGADYAHLAPIFDPLSKPAERPALGVSAVREAAKSGLPLFAQGGIDDACAASLANAGACGIAVTGHVLQAKDPVAAVRRLRAALGDSL